MTQALSESFCERCGTRYTFENPRTKAGALAGVRVLSKGLRKLALTRASSLDEALETARLDEEREANNRQLEEFHGTFHFCLSCRQYTCLKCWNPKAGACLTCAPTSESQAEEELAALRSAMAAERARAEAEARQAALEAERAYGATHLEPWLGGLGSGLASPAWPEQDRRPDPARTVDEWGRPIVASAPAAPTVDEWGRLVTVTPAAAAPVAPEPPPGPATAEPFASALTGAPQTGHASVAGDGWDVERERETGPAPAPALADEPAPARSVAAQPGPAAEVHAPETEAEAPEAEAAEMDVEPTDAVPARVAWLQPGTSLDDAIAAYEASLRGMAPSTQQDPRPEALAPVTTSIARHEADTLVAVEPEPEAEPVVAVAPEPESVVAVAPEPEPVVAAEPESVVAAEPEHEPVVAVEPEPEPVIAVEPEPEPKPEPEPEPKPEPVVAVEPERHVAPAAPVRPAAPQFVPGVTHQPATTEPVVLPVAPATVPASLRPAARLEPLPTHEPALPDPATFAEDPRLAAWSIVAPEVTPPPPGPSPAEAVRAAAMAVGALATGSGPGQATATAVRPMAGAHGCVKCGLSLSANARFCRRCGTRQA